MIEEFFTRIADAAALVMDAVVVVLLVFGAIEALFALLFRRRANERQSEPKRKVWLNFAVWIVLALEFALAADIIRTAIAPSWDAIGQLAAIAAIRTVLNVFLMRDINAEAAER